MQKFSSSLQCLHGDSARRVLKTAAQQVIGLSLGPEGDLLRADGQWFVRIAEN